jgi:NAD(P)-dependent dehydrogenase (short-subunit alcohol dehydrogenase family)
MSATRVIITGAASGIAAATRAELERRGAQVVGLDINAEEDGLIRCDVRDQASVDDAVRAAIERLGGLDVLINCAGLATPQSAGLAPDAKALAVIDVNLLGPWRVTSAALPALRDARGRVVNVASGMSFVALPFAAAYAMSKHGIVAYSGALRLEHGDAITVTSVYPGYIKTPIHRDSVEFGLTLEGSSPEERLEDAVGALTRAALGNPPRRDITTTRTGQLTNVLSRFAPRRFVDRVILTTMRKNLAGRSFNDPSSPVAQFASRLTVEANARSPRPDGRRWGPTRSAPGSPRR